MSEDEQEMNKGRHIFPIALSLIATLISGGIFLASLLYQLPLVEIAASLVTGVQVFFLSSTVADLIEREKTSPRRNSWAVVLAVLLVAFFSFTRYLR